MKRLFLILIVLLGFRGVSYAYENTYALIIGINAYKDKPLPYSINSAQAFYDFLRSEAGGSVPAENIVFLTDGQASKENIIAKTSELFSKAGKKDRVIFYFNGHGGRDLIGLMNSEILYYRDVKACFRKAKCGTKLMFVDACHTGSVKGAKKASVTRFRKKVNEMKGSSEDTDKNEFSNMNIAVMTATKAEEVGWQTGKFQKSVMTHFLIKGLGGEANRDGNGYITIQELYYYVYNKVTEETSHYETQQTPQLFGKFDLRLIVGKVNN